jgi:uncharacterized membrane protein HdeD (DUF308 family)
MESTQQRPRAEVSGLTRGLIVRGVVAIVFAIALLAWPGIGLRALVLVFGAYSLIDGCVALYSAIASPPPGQRWWLVLHGLAGIGVGVTTYFWTGLTALALLYLIGTWAIVLGVMEIGGAFAAPLPGGDRILLGLHGLLGLGFGAIMWWRPGAGALALITLIAAFALVTGMTLIVVAMQLRGRGEGDKGQVHPGGVAWT